MLCVAEALSSVVWANGPVGARILVAGSGDTCSVLVCFPCKRPMFVCPSLRKYLLTSPSLPSFPREPGPALPPSQVPRAVNERGCNDVLHVGMASSQRRVPPPVPEHTRVLCIALLSRFCTALERNKHRSDPRRAQLNSSQRQGHTVRSRPARFWPRTSTTTAREPLSTQWRKSRSPSTRSSCAKVRHRACVCTVGLTARHAAAAAAAPQVTRAITFM